MVSVCVQNYSSGTFAESNALDALLHFSFTTVLDICLIVRGLTLNRFHNIHLTDNQASGAPALFLKTKLVLMNNFFEGLLLSVMFL